MAFYKYMTHLVPNQHQAFDNLWEPGTSAPSAGVYRCEVCGHEIGIAKTHVLPPQNHHTHRAGAPPIRWRLIVAAQN
jgi:hypothetical protein